MARTGTGTGTLLSRRNVKLDSFLKRNMERAVYERIRVHEPCVVVSDTINKVYMHVVLSDERVFLTEYPPRTLTVAVSFGRVRDIELVNDLPDFLRGKDQERCQHIRIVYAVETPPPRRRRDRLTRERGEELPPVTPPPRSLTPKSTSEGHPPDSSLDQWTEEDPPPIPKPLRSASCPNPQTLSLLKVPRPPGPPFSSPPSPSRQSRAQGPRRISLILDRLLRRDRADPSEDKGAELHLYAVSHSSTIYLHLQSAWTRFLTRSTLLLDPLHRWRCSSGWDPPPPSNRSGWLLGRLSRELQRDGVSPEASCLLLRELRTAARRDVALRRLFWRSGDLFVFLVRSLEDGLHGVQSLSGGLWSDQLLLSTLIVQTLAVMFRDTEVEESRMDLLSANRSVYQGQHEKQEESGSLPVLPIWMGEERLILPHPKDQIHVTTCQRETVTERHITSHITSNMCTQPCKWINHTSLPACMCA
ncbi:uncharacterized protein C12orf56 homolog isoform X2 [Salarias fasciatus]|uniref:uncharacterized protein C12orf56 homolog isoform X2 n=1 Tax=Salarias fasciatus TaxID=181472 RepID=UPI001176BD86|nr:uncharacterized protein C12orf56 homolog isoform X2 [Salarias fasciatus]